MPSRRLCRSEHGGRCGAACSGAVFRHNSWMFRIATFRFPSVTLVMPGYPGRRGSPPSGRRDLPRRADVSSANGVIMSKARGKVVHADGRYPARTAGPLAAEVHGFRTELIRAGYTARTSQDNAYVLACLSRWLEAEGLAPAELTTGRLERFARARRDAGYRR